MVRKQNHYVYTLSFISVIMITLVYPFVEMELLNGPAVFDLWKGWVQWNWLNSWTDETESIVPKSANLNGRRFDSLLEHHFPSVTSIHVQ